MKALLLTAFLLIHCVASPLSAEVATPLSPPGVTESVVTKTPALPPPTTSPSTVSVPVNSAPPQWAQDLITTAEKLPVVGPLVAKALYYDGILVTVLTALIGTIWGILSTLMGVFNASGLTGAAAAVAAFRDGKFMYWLTFFSQFNAKKKPDQPV